MGDKLDQTMKILRSSKVRTDERGRTVWNDPVETAKLELMSTQMLKKIIDDGDAKDNETLREVATGGDGLLARDIDNGRFEVISDEELQHILDGTDKEYEANRAAAVADETPDLATEADQDLELVSTQMLRVILGTELDEEKEEIKEAGFNPYDNS